MLKKKKKKRWKRNLKTPCVGAFHRCLQKSATNCWPWERTVICQPHASSPSTLLASGSQPAPRAETWSQPVEQGRSPRCAPPARLQALQGLSGCQRMECREESSFPPSPTPHGNALVTEGAPRRCRAPSGPALGTRRRGSVPGKIQPAR